VALNATIHTFDIALADADRGVYDSLALRVARHPSESEPYLVTRVLAYALEYAPGIGFSRGLSTPDEPAIHVRDDTGALQAWIDIGAPDPARLHKAAKAAPRVAVYTHRAHPAWLRALADAKIHRAEALALYAPDRALVDALVAALERRNMWSISVSGGQLYVSTRDDGETLAGGVATLSMSG